MHELDNYLFIIINHCKITFIIFIKNYIEHQIQTNILTLHKNILYISDFINIINIVLLLLTEKSVSREQYMDRRDAGV